MRWSFRHPLNVAPSNLIFLSFSNLFLSLLIINFALIWNSDYCSQLDEAWNMTLLLSFWNWPIGTTVHLNFVLIALSTFFLLVVSHGVPLPIFVIALTFWSYFCSEIDLYRSTLFQHDKRCTKSWMNYKRAPWFDTNIFNMSVIRS